MTYYRNQRYCTFWEECKNGQRCQKALSPQVQARAQLDHGIDKGEPSILTFKEKPGCFKAKPVKRGKGEILPRCKKTASCEAQQPLPFGNTGH